MKTKVKQSKTLDMGNGPIWGTFKKIWIPALVTALIAGTFTVVDTLFISFGYHPDVMGDSLMNTKPSDVSAIGVAAMTYAVPFTFFIVGTGTMYGSSIAQKMARAKANGDKEEVQRLMNSYLPTIYKSGIFLGIIFFLLAKPLVWMGSGFQPYLMENWFNNPEVNAIFGRLANEGTITGQQLSQAAWFIRIQAIGAIPFMCMVSGALILRVSGKASKATLFSFVALITNIVLDFFFIVVLGLNLFGAALATIIAQYCTMMLYRVYFKSKADIKITGNEWTLAKTQRKDNKKLGRSALFLQAIMAIILLSSTMGIGIVFWGQQEVVTLYQSSFQGFYALFSFANMILIGTCLTMQPIVAFNNEKGYTDRVKATKSLAMRLSLSIGIAYTLLMIFFPQLASIFVRMPGDWNNAYPQRILQMLFLSYVPYIYTTVSANFSSAIGDLKKANRLTLVKPIILFPLVIGFGFAFLNMPPGTWVGLGFIGDSLEVVSSNTIGLEKYVGEYLPLGIFWAFTVSEIPSFLYSIKKPNVKKIHHDNFIHKKEEKESLKSLSKFEREEMFKRQVDEEIGSVDRNYLEGIDKIY